MIDERFSGVIAVLLLGCGGGQDVPADGYAWYDGAQWSTATVSFPSELVRGDGVWVGASYQRRWHAVTHAGPWVRVLVAHGVRDMAAGPVVR